MRRWCARPRSVAKSGDTYAAPRGLVIRNLLIAPLRVWPEAPFNRPRRQTAARNFLARDQCVRTDAARVAATCFERPAPFVLRGARLRADAFGAAASSARERCQARYARYPRLPTSS